MHGRNNFCLNDRNRPFRALHDKICWVVPDQSWQWRPKDLGSFFRLHHQPMTHHTYQQGDHVHLLNEFVVSTLTSMQLQLVQEWIHLVNQIWVLESKPRWLQASRTSSLWNIQRPNTPDTSRKGRGTDNQRFKSIDCNRTRGHTWNSGNTWWIINGSTIDE